MCDGLLRYVSLVSILYRDLDLEKFTSRLELRPVPVRVKTRSVRVKTRSVRVKTRSVRVKTRSG